MKRCCTCCLGRETTPPSYATERIPCKAKAPLLPGRQTPSISPSAAERCETTMGQCTWCITTRSRLGYKSLSFASVQVMPSIALQNVKQIETSKSHNVLSTPHVLKFPRWVARRTRGTAAFSPPVKDQEHVGYEHYQMHHTLEIVSRPRAKSEQAHDQCQDQLLARGNQLVSVMKRGAAKRQAAFAPRSAVGQAPARSPSWSRTQ